MPLRTGRRCGARLFQRHRSVCNTGSARADGRDKKNAIFSVWPAPLRCRPQPRKASCGGRQAGIHAQPPTRQWNHPELIPGAIRDRPSTLIRSAADRRHGESCARIHGSTALPRLSGDRLCWWRDYGIILDLAICLFLPFTSNLNPLDRSYSGKRIAGESLCARGDQNVKRQYAPVASHLSQAISMCHRFRADSLVAGRQRPHGAARIVRRVSNVAVGILIDLAAGYIHIAGTGEGSILLKNQ